MLHKKQLQNHRFPRHHKIVAIKIPKPTRTKAQMQQNQYGPFGATTIQNTHGTNQPEPTKSTSTSHHVRNTQHKITI